MINKDFLQCSNCAARHGLTKKLVFTEACGPRKSCYWIYLRRLIGSTIQQKGPHTLNLQPSSNSSASSPYAAYADGSLKVTIFHLSVVILVQGRGRVTEAHSAPLPQPHIHPTDRFRAGNQPAHPLEITLCPFHTKSTPQPLLKAHLWKHTHSCNGNNGH